MIQTLNWIDNAVAQGKSEESEKQTGACKARSFPMEIHMNRRCLIPVLCVLTCLSMAAVAVAQQPGSAPALVANGPRAILSLDGTWQVQPVDNLQFSYPPPATGWKDEQVPLTSTPSIKSAAGGYYGDALPAYMTKDGALKLTQGTGAWFKRSFEVPAGSLAGKRAILHFGGMAFRSATYLNGQKLGEWVLGQVPVDYDVTSVLKPGAANEVCVALTAREGIIDVPNRTFIAPTFATDAGIWGDVELRLVPEARIDDLFIKTSVSQKQITIDTTLVNAGKTPRTVTPSALVVDKSGTPQTTVAGPAVTLAAGETKTVTLSQDWLAPHLWAPETPALYFAQVSITDAKGLVDRKAERFGFREFEIRGRDFYLNGVRTVLLRNSFLTGLGANPEDVYRMVRAQAGKPYNCARLHLGFQANALFDAADELGLMLVPESAWANALDAKTMMDKKDLWLPNIEAYTRAFIKLHRNNPSVIIWSLDNETQWEMTDDAHMAIADRVLAAAKSVDTTRPFQADGDNDWGGRLPICNIHYPEGEVANALRAKYPNSGFVFPNDFYWLSKDGVNEAWRAKFKWDRPLVIGEYWDASGDPELRSGFMGESVYDWQKWRSQDFSGRDSKPDNEYQAALQGITDAYRIMGVAGVNPWAGDRQIVMPPVAVRPVDFFPNCFGGQTNVRKVMVFNDTSRNYDYMNLQCRLVSEGRTLWEKIIDIDGRAGVYQTVDVPVACPVVSRQVPANLEVRLRMWEAGGFHQIGLYEDRVFLMPRADLSDLSNRGLVLLDSSGETAKALGSLGLKLTPVAAVSAESLGAAKTLIIGRNTNATPFRSAITAYAKAGGRVLVLQQDNWIPLAPALPESDSRHVSTRSWKRAWNSPVTAGLDDHQLSYWRPDHLVSLKTFDKPASGTSVSLLDCGGLFGLRWSPLLQVPFGDGVFLLSQLNLTDRVDAEPLAGHLLDRLIRGCLDYEPKTTQPLGVLAGTNDALKKVLAACNVATAEGVGAGPTLVDATAPLTAADVEKLKASLAGGGTVWLHGFSAATIANVAGLLPFKAEFVDPDKTVLTGIRRSTDPLMSGISSGDLAWARLDIGGRLDYFEAAKATTPLGGPVLKVPSLDAGEPLIEPGLLVKIPVGKGTVLFDTLLWDQALGAEGDKVSRLVSRLAANMGAKLVEIGGEEKSYAYSYVDLARFATAGYYEPPGGLWDMRYFLINHTGKVNGMEVAGTEFPAVAKFAGRPFTLVDPKKNGGKAVVALRGEHQPTLPETAQGLSLGRKADKLWFLHAAAWAPADTAKEIARYVIRYADGTQEVFPLRYENEVGDWYAPKPLPGARVGWTGSAEGHSPIGLFVTEWTNPHPEKVIATMDVVGHLQATNIILVGVTAGVEQNAPEGQALVADWNFAMAANQQVPNGVTGGGPLTFDEKASPTLAELAGEKGLRFKDGQRLNGNPRQTPGLGVAGPFTLEMRFAPEGKPVGYMSGLYSDLIYDNAGFRLVIGPRMNLSVEIYTGLGHEKARYITGKTVLELGRFYTATLKFDGKFAYLYLDGKLDGSVETAPPAPCLEPLEIGDTPGKDYLFTGIISSVKVLSQTETSGH